MGERIKMALPVTVDGDNDLVDEDGFCVAYEGNVAPYNAVMKEVAIRVNNHERLVEALKDAEDALLNADSTGRDIEAENISTLLAQLKADKGGE